MRLLNPADHSLLCDVPEDTPSTLAEKVAAARAAQPGWAQRPLPERLEIIRRFGQIIEERKAELAVLLTREMGKPIRQSHNELAGLAGRIAFFLEHAEATLADEMVHSEEGLSELITREPLGLVVNVSAWNYPYYVGSNVFLPALLAGNAVLYKPSEFATLIGLEIGRALHEAGVPADVFTVVIGGGEVGATLIGEPVDAVFFTGSHATGVKIASACAPRLLKVQLELGGKDPVYVCDDVDIPKAAEALAEGALYNGGQSCCAVERIYVHARIHDAFLAAFVATAKTYQIGDPMLDSTFLGPLARGPQLELLEGQIADALAKGARLLLGGKRLARPGNWFEPTVLADVNHTMALMRDESFGPIIGIQSVADDEEAVALMKDTEYGLTAGVYTPDEARARRILAQVPCGSAYWNCCDRVSPRLPWSGVGHSGLGLTLSTEGIRTFTRPKAWHLRNA